MFKLLKKFMKPFFFGFILALGLLFVQAFADLNLPNYMSDIVNVGIQQQGVEEDVPYAIAKEDFDGILTISSEENATLLRSNYTLGGDIPQLGIEPSSDVYAYTGTLDEEAMESVSSAFGTAFYTLQFMNEGNSLASAQEMAAQVDSTLKLQSVPFATVEFYKSIGVDLSSYQSDYIMRTGLFMLLISLVGGTASILVTLISARLSAGVARDLRSAVFRKVENFSNEDFDKFSVASLITRSTNDINQIQLLLNVGIRLLCYAPIMGIGGIIMALEKSVSMGWILVLAIACLVGVVAILLVVTVPKFKSMQKLIDKLNLVAREGLNGLLVVKAFGNEGFEKKRFDMANMDLSKVALFINRSMSWLFPVIMLIMNGASLLVVWVGADYVASSSIQVGDIIAFMQYTMQVIMSFLMIVMVFMFIPRAQVSAERIMEVLNTEISIVDPENPVHISPSNKGNLEFKNVSFKYHGAEGYAIENISFKATAGMFTAFIGATGSGKSTIVNLIPRFYDAQEGEILVDGVNVKDMKLKELRSHIGLVPQKNVLLSGSIKSNIEYGKELENDQLMDVTKTAQAYDFIMDKEAGFESEITQGGTNVSGGQRQRLAIARALATDSDIYIFDDSFSALDFKTDSKLRKELKEHLVDETVIIVGQRISTIMDADQIYVIDNGKIVGSGTHKELLKSCSEYLEIALSQLSEEEVNSYE